MKEKFNEECIIDTRCGLSCVNCEFRERTGCGSCIATNGHPFHGECSVAICCQNKGFLHWITLKVQELNSARNGQNKKSNGNSLFGRKKYE